MTGTCPAVWYQSAWSHKRKNKCCASENSGKRERNITGLRTKLTANICKRVEGDGSLLGNTRVNPCAWERAQNRKVPLQVSILKYYSKGLMIWAHGRKTAASGIFWWAVPLPSQHLQSQDWSMYFNEFTEDLNNSQYIKAAQIIIYFSLCTLWSGIHSLALKSRRNKAELWCCPLITTIWASTWNVEESDWQSRGEPATPLILGSV